ncbi:Tol-Pal system protein TolB [Campylobacter sp. VBCF_05 NA6]|uniref:Tol-Pal system protein TolB n=1 Tax=unclassified Campylobacter TaxID=2593542 RepID=UPI0022E9EF8A|nr:MULTISPECIES: Tol-Pal system protein TolB [unclassified Campylobacter]MDA3057480.1 Tol-Pal system protein TolB [Campylobacter sp. VBCF_04 NA7]MDA3058948.1 Tol-Pal system protein TolB [Campylobacter sp. VBCF_05 NA6]
MKNLMLIFAFCMAVFAADATTTITNEGVSLPRIVVQNASNLSNAEFNNKFFKLMVGDLKVGATFDVSDEYLVSDYNGDANSNLGELGAALIVRYAVSDKTSPMNLKAKVIEAGTGRVMYEKSFSLSNAEKYPFLAHMAVSEIVKELGYSDVDWMKEMILLSRYTSTKESEIMVADYTLTYQKVVLRGGLNIFPKWASAAQNEFYYTYYVNQNTPAIYKYNLSNGSKSKIFTGKGMTIVGDVSSDGRKLLITNAPKDQPDIYLYDIGSGSAKQITDYPGIDVNGNFIDGDSRVAFVSDRLGYPNIFATSINGGNVTQMVYHGKNNNSISTNGNYIVYSSRDGSGSFNIYMISTQTDMIRQLTSGGKNMFPRFSSDGGSVMYIKQAGGGSSVGIIRVNENKSFQFPLKIGQIQSVDW